MQRARPEQEGKHTHTATAVEMTGECSGGKDQKDRGLDVENNRLYSRSPELDHLSRLRQHLSAASL